MRGVCRRPRSGIHRLQKRACNSQPCLEQSPIPSWSGFLTAEIRFDAVPLLKAPDLLTFAAIQPYGSEPGCHVCKAPAKTDYPAEWSLHTGAVPGSFRISTWETCALPEVAAHRSDPRQSITFFLSTSSLLDLNDISRLSPALISRNQGKYIFSG